MGIEVNDISMNDIIEFMNIIMASNRGVKPEELGRYDVITEEEMFIKNANDDT